MSIDAFAAQAAKQTLTPFTYPTPHLGPFDVLIAVTHCGVCFSDIHLIDDDWKRSIYPLVPGHEVVGTIVQKGDMVKLPIGARVGVSWLFNSCLECETCLAGNTDVCPKRRAICVGHHGGFATQMTADSRFVYPIPETMESAIAAPLLCAGATVYAPFRRLGIQAPHRIAVIGIGGLGHLALQFGRAFGCAVTAISSSSDKEKEARSFGAEGFLTLEQIQGHPTQHALAFDFILSTVHTDLDWNLICSLLKTTGTLCLLGKPPHAINLDPLTSLSSQRTITGSAVANRLLIHEMLGFAAHHKIQPQIEIMKMSQINEAIQRVRENKARYRIVLTNES